MSERTYSAFRPLFRRYDNQSNEFGWCMAQGKSYFLMIGSYGIGWVHHPGPDCKTFQIFHVNGPSLPVGATK